MASLDPSIILGVKPLNLAQPDPIERFTKLAGVQEITGKLADQEQVRADDRATREAFKAGGSESEILKRLMAVSPKAGLAYQKQMLEAQQTQSNITKNTAQGQKATWEVDRDKLQHGAAMLDHARDQQSFETVLRLGQINGTFKPEFVAQMLQQGYSPQLVEQLKASGLTRAQQLTEQGNAATRAETGRHNVQTEATQRGQLGVAQGNLAETRRHHGVTEGQGQLGAPIEVNTPDGPRLVMQDKRTGQLLDANTRQPITGGVGPKLGETSQKQQVGVATTRDAISEYRDALKTFSIADAANPAARARMGTIYNNMLLQAKEAYNLGVLNGPDYEILQQVITNPASARGTFTSKQALDDQAAKLDAIMERVGSRITQTQSGITPATRPQSQETKTVGGKTYVKRNGQWFEQ